MLRRMPLLAGLAAGIGLVVRLRRRGRAGPDALDPRALELRRRLDEARADPAAETPQPGSEPRSEPRSEPGSEELDERRRAVHEQGRRAAEQMRPSDGDAT